MTGSGVRNECDAKARARIDRRTSLVPAPAVIPAPIAYIKVVAVKKLVVGLRPARPGPNVFSTSGRAGRPRSPIRRPFTLSVVTGRSSATSTLNKSECSKRARVARTIKQGMVEDDPPACACIRARARFRPHRFDEADGGHDLQRRTGASVLGRER